MRKDISGLEQCFKLAIKNKQDFVAVKVEMIGFPEAEIIVNAIANAEAKLEYYKKVYDDNLLHKYSEGIKIIDYAYGESMEEIVFYLNNK